LKIPCGLSGSKRNPNSAKKTTQRESKLLLTRFKTRKLRFTNWRARYATLNARLGVKMMPTLS